MTYRPAIAQEEYLALKFLGSRLRCNAHDIGEAVSGGGQGTRKTSALGVKLAFNLYRHGYADKIYDRKKDCYNYIITKQGELFLGPRG